MFINRIEQNKSLLCTGRKLSLAQHTMTTRTERTTLKKEKVGRSANECLWIGQFVKPSMLMAFGRKDFWNMLLELKLPNKRICNSSPSFPSHPFSVEV